MSTRIQNVDRQTFASTRGVRYVDYSDIALSERRRDAKYAARATLAEARHVVGRFVLAGNVVLLEAVEMSPAYYIDPRAPLTREYSKFARWRTRQAAWQWLQRNGDVGCLQVVNLEQLPGCDDGDAADLDAG